MNSNGQPKTRIISIYDYPEHLNPFYEDDNHNKIRFWTIGRKKSRSNSFSLSGIRNAMTLRSFRGRKDSKTEPTSPDEPVLRSRIHHLPRSTQSVPTSSEDVSPTRYVYGGSVTPTPQPRFHHNSPTTPGDKSGSRLSVNSEFEQPGRPPRAHKKKRRAPPPPTLSNLSVSVPDIKPDDEALKVELKIIEEPKENTEELSEKVDQNVNSNSKHDSVTVELKIVEETSEEISKNSVEETILNNETQQGSEKDGHLEETHLTSSKDSLQISETITTKEEIQKTEDSTKQTIACEPSKSHEHTTTIISESSEITSNENEPATENESVQEKLEPTETVNTSSEVKTNLEISVTPPTPKVRTVLTSNSVTTEEKSLEQNAPQEDKSRDKENKERENENDTAEDKTNYEGDMEAKLLADMEELDKSTNQIKEWLEELHDDEPQTSTQNGNKDDTNNNHVPAWSQFYRSVSTVANGKHRAEITNVNLNSSPENSPSHK